MHAFLVLVYIAREQTLGVFMFGLLPEKGRKTDGDAMIPNEKIDPCKRSCTRFKYDIHTDTQYIYLTYTVLICRKSYQVKRTLPRTMDIHFFNHGLEQVDLLFLSCTFDMCVHLFLHAFFYINVTRRFAMQLTYLYIVMFRETYWELFLEFHACTI
jgi:hypothetical protein